MSRVNHLALSILNLFTLLVLAKQPSAQCKFGFLRTCDAPLMHLVEHFPSVKRAVRLDMKHADFAMPTEAALHFFERLETIAMDIGISKESFFWSDLFALKVFRRVSNIITYNSMPEYQAQVDDGALFEFITDFSLMPADKPRVVQLGPFTDDSIDALKRRFNKSKHSWSLALEWVLT